MPVSPDRELHRQSAGVGRSGPGPTEAERRSRRSARCGRPGADGSRHRSSATGPRPLRPAWVNAMSIRLLLSSLLPLNSARPPSPWRITRSAGAIRSIASGQSSRRLGLRGLQQSADLGKILQCCQLNRGAALRMATIRQHLTSDFLRQEPQRTGQEAGMLGQCHGRGDQALQCRQRPWRPAPRRAGSRTGCGHRKPTWPSAFGGTHRPPTAAKKS